jgi:POT family proton-dependent oligopeptide transporter
VVLGHQFPASWFQSVQPLFVIALAPVFAWLWLALGRREPSSPGKFTLGLLLVGLSFAIMVPPARGGLVSPWWLVGCYFLATLGELCLSPIGLSAMTKLAPTRIGGFVMGIWFLGTAIGNWLAGRAGGLFESMPLPQLFGAVAASAIAAGLVLGLLIKPTVRMMSGVK